MPDDRPVSRRWIGRTIVGISILHTTFAFVVFWKPIQEMIAAGLIASVGEDPMRGAVTWFFFAGLFMALTGLAIDLLEKNSARSALKVPGIFLLLTTLLGIMMMPASGFWFLLVPAIAMIWNRQTQT